VVTECDDQPAVATWLDGGGEMGAMMRAHDWTRTPLGPVEDWPQSLRTAVTICLGSRFPILIWWGPEFIKLYNDAYRPILGSKHPRSLGQRGQECWHEIWHIIGPMLEGVRHRGVATWSNDQMLPLHRLGFTEECYFTFTYSPIREDAGNVAGVFCAVIETTERVLAVRRLATLRELAGNAPAAHDAIIACDDAVRTLASTPEDSPFAAMYLLDGDATTLRRVATKGWTGSEITLPATIAMSDPGGTTFESAARQACRGGSQGLQVLDAGEAGLPELPGRPWPDTIRAVALLAVAQPGQPRPYGVLAVGLSPRRPFDESYRDFLSLASGHIATALANSRAIEQERRRIQSLTELDRAKTTFFTNVSHEFRTPLTLMLGPLEQSLAAHAAELPSGMREDLQTTYRNALRLLKLVNTLLDFSRIEAGRMQPSFEPTDAGALTAELASVFRSAVEAAGLRYVVECEAGAASVALDRQMWEKVVFNLLSNALKFTLQGEIAVRLRSTDAGIELQVSDTGIGIAPEEQPHVFERFHRLRNPGARSEEGTGIGLALSQELVRLHGGTLTVASEPGRGSVFTVTLPRRSRPHEQTRSPAALDLRASAGSIAYLNEAVGWLPGRDARRDGSRSSSEAPAGARPAQRGVSQRACVLVADDNADMRDYLRRLCEQRWDVQVACDGAAALAAIQARRPDLVLADVMMPGLDGLALVQRLRADPETRELPVILLSARAGEESRLEGLQAGASDYLVKPFSARELLAHVEARLEVARIRREAEESLRQSATLNAIQRDALQMAVSGAPVEPVLEMLAGAGRRLLGDDVRTAVWIKEVDEGWLRFGASVGLPEQYSREVGRVAIDSESVSCGQAAFLGVPVIVRDLTADSRWEPFLPLARAAGVSACWSFPIRSAEGRVLGTYAVYQPEPCEPTPAESDRMATLTQTAAIVLEHYASARLREAAETQLREADRRKDEFIAMLAHELRNPLAPIRAGLQAIRRGSGHSIDLTRIGEIMERQVTHMVRLVDDLLDASRISSGKLVLQKEPSLLAELVQGAVDANRAAIAAAGVELSVRLPAEPVPLDVDPTRFVQIVSNLLHNAAKFTPRGGHVELGARIDHGAGPPGELALEVRDDGVGIASDLLPRVFDLFAQGEPPVHGPSQGGLGIGLALARRLVEMHGGRLEAHSDGPDSGSTFSLRLPLPLPRESRERAPGGDPAALAGGACIRRVLIVDDNVDAADALGMLVRLLGGDARIAHDGTMGLESASEFRPDVVLLDLGMPGIDGYETCRRLRASGSAAYVVALTGWGQEQDKVRALQSGFDAHLTKPADPALLERLLIDGGLAAVHELRSLATRAHGRA
jgi:signal transduction histidine kinase/DNA-binding response OmpR family regulator